LLKNSKFQYLNYGEGNIPPFLYFKVFIDSIQKELNNDTINLDNLSSTKPQLYKIYNFLTDKKKLTSSFQEFVLTINGMPLPPADSTWTAYQTDKKKKDNLKYELRKTNLNIYSSNDLTDMAKWISIIVLTIVYPFRFLYLLLRWAVKTLRQK
jgi:hypothetical protein